jgi:hypothetical protein
VGRRVRGHAGNAGKGRARPPSLQIFVLDGRWRSARWKGDRSDDDFGFRAAEEKVHVNDLHVSMLGLDHKRLTYFSRGRDFRLTDVGGEFNLAARLRSA